MSTALDEHRVPRFPEKISLETLPSHLRDNPIARLHTLLPDGVEADLVALSEDLSLEEVVQELADAR